jgi:hypothetical protein
MIAAPPQEFATFPPRFKVSVGNFSEFETTFLHA